MNTIVEITVQLLFFKKRAELFTSFEGSSGAFLPVMAQPHVTTSVHATLLQVLESDRPLKTTVFEEFWSSATAP